MDSLTNLLVMQREQLDHDLRAHRDILALSTQSRLAHMTLHFAKYVGVLSGASDLATVQRVLVDALIIGLASANSLNVDLSKRIPEQCNVNSMNELTLSMSINGSNVHAATLRLMAIATGRMAKACESMDHMERYDCRGNLEREVVEISCIVLAAFKALAIDPSDLIRTRWRQVERKSIFANSNSTEERAHESFLLPQRFKTG